MTGQNVDARRAQQRPRYLPPPSGTVATAVVSHMPARVQPYLRLMRLQGPIGTWLFVLPGWWALSLAAEGLPNLGDFVLFGVAALLMRGSACAVNDVVDRKFDAQVTRTASRPVASGAVSVADALAFAVAQAVASLALFWWASATAALIVALCLPTYLVYPFMKRIMPLPQAWLGLCFNTLVFAGWAAVTGTIGAPAVLLWAAGVFWTLGYDTIYGHQDREDDRRIGVKSTSLLFGRATAGWVAVFYVLALAGLVGAGLRAEVHWPFFVLLTVAAAHLIWQVATLDIDDPERCRLLFVANRVTGGLILLATIAGHWG
ncbi:4-hydroxybenzoate octaprenyltransferase [Paractinoplanes brasiliensis]|uniref:4-hydroxybenzoate octaprenyltransferase n=1 Tax=Paractinoplanes brasiliensis TaxID=52695 RepID=A0A4R6JLV7_9ACTN|nr:4-hydroxybenzoate octaprenyltransferase [Actinoplanes brasiliensis]TDO37119.1 4-hydroxybenzoate polyprenyltransferase [Actinoplanes brasiliensis]GID32185.1 4-hydroxybenzoate octaprenyltransferase [Actinoplanes brasiliensis]